MKRLPDKVFFFVGTLTVFFLLIHAGIRLQLAKNQERSISEAQMLQQEIEERFNLLLQAPLALGLVSSEYFTHHGIAKEEYERLSGRVILMFGEILGFNHVSVDGTITHVYPFEPNREALNKKSQNHAFMLESFRRNEPYWFSPPFPLYQGVDGFIFYIPVVTQNRLSGWVASVISLERFFKKFISARFLRHNHLILRDIETQRNYFATDLSPRTDQDIVKRTTKIFGREIEFLSWSKEKRRLLDGHWPISVIIALLIAAILTYAYWLLETRILNRRHQEELTALMKVTVQDTAKALENIQYQFELIKLGAGHVSIEKISRQVSYIESLVQQVTLLQKLASPEQIRKTEMGLIEMILELSEVSSDRLNRKKLLLLYDPARFEGVYLHTNKWMLCHSVFGNIINHAIQNSTIGGNIQIAYQRMENQHEIIFQYSRGPDIANEDQTSEVPLFIARKILELQEGALEETTKDGIQTVTVKIPA